MDVFLVAFLLPSVSLEKCPLSDDDFDVAQIILFYAPWNSSLIREQIVLYWNNPFFNEGDIVALFYGDPKTNDNKLLFSHQPSRGKGFIKTEVSPSQAVYGLDLTFVEQCTGYYGAWLRDNVIRKTRCLLTHPDWMSKRRNTIGRKSLRRIILPGTHDSGAYGEEPQPSVEQRYTETQDRDIFDQLISGARYLDIRPAWYDGEYWVNHGTYKMQLLDNVIYDVKEFMENTEEIVILGFKQFPVGFNSNEDHEKFIKYLETEFADLFLLPRPRDSWAISLNEIWATGRRLILSYDHPIQQTVHSLWIPVKQQWGDVKDIHQLKKYLDTVEEEAGENYIQSYPKIPRATMAEITLDLWRIVGDAVVESLSASGTQSLRQLGVKVGPLITAWYNEFWFSTANIVAVDFLDATGIVEIAIDWNDRRVSPCYNYYKDLYTNMTQI
ncbi:PI-PLC X domain-containing protein 1-like [Chelonus insularis]|uniref:PI-PLC X domain-containing protein 1-like n=1 Tax=Chelonus insularis TaxID=460826 RepID=UPI0015899D43|nr:PI-PLC X domain-containing protein 1-like [Chelonus insularis]